MIHPITCQYLNTFIFFSLRLGTRDQKVADKSLYLVSYLLTSNADIISMKGPSKRKTVSRTRTKSRSLSSSSNQYNDENSDLETQVTTSVHYQFLEKFKDYLNNEPTSFKNLLLKHLKVMTQKMPLSMQHDLFATILLPNFRSLFPIGKLDKFDVPFSLSDGVDLIRNYLDLIFICLTNNNTLVVLFCKYEGIEILKKLSLNENEEITLRAIYLLDFLCWLTKINTEKSKTGTSKRITDEKLRTTYQEIAFKAISSVFQIAHKQTDEVLVDLSSFTFMKKDSLMENFSNLLDLFHDKDFESTLDTSILIKFGKMFMCLTEKISASRESHTSWSAFLKWTQVLLPLKMVDMEVLESNSYLLFNYDLLIEINHIFHESFGSFWKRQSKRGAPDNRMILSFYF